MPSVAFRDGAMTAFMCFPYGVAILILSAYFSRGSAEFSLYSFQKFEINFVWSWRFIASFVEGPELMQDLFHMERLMQSL